MRQLWTALLAASLLSFSACSLAGQPTPPPDSAQSGGAADQSAESAPNASSVGTAAGGGRVAEQSRTAASYETQKVSLEGAGQAPATVFPERKVIRNAELTVELEAPAEAQRRLASVAEQHGGFVVTSESRQEGAGRGRAEVVTVEMRVPSAQFDSVINGIRGLGGSIRQEKLSGRDVTEEYIDLEARLRAQRALEAQILEIMKRAQRVSDALEVNAQLAQVRGEIERVEGRRRFLENQSSLSTIRVTLRPPAPLVSAETVGFLSSVRRAFGEGVDVAAAIVVGLVRVGAALTPVALLFGVPAALIFRLARRRFWRPRRDELRPDLSPSA
jgi:hypothetical protein